MRLYRKDVDGFAVFEEFYFAAPGKFLDPLDRFFNLIISHFKNVPNFRSFYGKWDIVELIWSK